MIFAATGGDWLGGAKQHFYRLIFATFFMLLIALIDLRFWYTISYPFYIVILMLLISVDIMGVTVNGSKRWIDLQIANYELARVQPSEIMKLGIVLALARVFIMIFPALARIKRLRLIGSIRNYICSHVFHYASARP